MTSDQVALLMRPDYGVPCASRMFRLGVPVIVPNPDGSATEVHPPKGTGVLVVSEVDRARGIITVRTR